MTAMELDAPVAAPTASACEDGVADAARLGDTDDAAVCVGKTAVGDTTCVCVAATAAAAAAADATDAADTADAADAAASADAADAADAADSTEATDVADAAEKTDAADAADAAEADVARATNDDAAAGVVAATDDRSGDEDTAAGATMADVDSTGDSNEADVGELCPVDEAAPLIVVRLVVAAVDGRVAASCVTTATDGFSVVDDGSANVVVGDSSSQVPFDAIRRYPGKHAVQMLSL